MPRHVTAGVDGSGESLAAADWAAREALRRQVPLRLLYAWEWQPRPPTTVPPDDAQRLGAWRLLDDAQAEIAARHPGLQITADLVAGSPPAVLQEAAAQAELLALGSRGLGPVTGFLIGSVSLQTVAHAARPVVLVRAGHTAQHEHLPDADRHPSAGTAYREVVVGLDLLEPADELIEFAFDAADCRSARLHVVHTWDFPPLYGYAAGSPDPLMSAEMEADEQRFLSTTLQPWRAKFPGVEVTEDLVRGRAGHHLVRAASGAGLVVVGRRARHSAIGPHIGHVAHAVLRHVRSPVAVVPH